jgi:uncharacterized protein
MNKKLSHAELIEKINAFIEKYQSDLSYCHGYDHARRTAKLAVMLGKQENADCRIIEIASLLHDIGYVPLAWARHASGKDDNDFQDFLGEYLLRTNDHGELGAIIAGRFLEGFGYQDDNRQQVAQIIREHNKKTGQTSLESQIINDADKLEMLGATWVARAFQRTNAFDRRLSIESVPENYLNRKEAFLSTFHTKTAKKMAAERYRFLMSFNEQFKREMRLEA